MPAYDLAQIRQLLAAAFSSGEINTLAFDLFYDLHGDFSAGMSKSDRIRRIVEEAERNGRIPHLLAYVQEHTPYQYNRFAPHLIREEPAPTATAKRAGWRQRKAQLEQHIKADLQLLADFEDKLRLEENPRSRLRWEREIERQQEALAGYRRELEALERDIETESTPADNQTLLAAIADLKQTVTRQHGESQGERRRMEARLAAGQQEILAHIERRHRQTIKTVLARLDDNQLELVNMMLREAEKGRIARQEATDLFNQTVRILQILQAQPDGDYWRRLLHAVEEPASLEQKLKLTLPIIPAILEYETELAVDGMGWLRDSWRTLTARARRRS